MASDSILRIVFNFKKISKPFARLSSVNQLENINLPIKESIPLKREVSVNDMRAIY